MSSDEEETGPKYNAGKKVSINDLMKADAEDESLRKYKESLLGAAGKDGDAHPKDDPRRVVMKEFAIILDGRETLTAKVDSPESLKALAKKPFILKEGARYKRKFVFKVQHDIVSGLSCKITASKMGIKKKDSTMIGSFGPQGLPYEMVLPKNDWEEAPEGRLLRGDYNFKTEFIDDDGVCHLAFDWMIKIVKEWGDK